MLTELAHWNEKTLRNGPCRPSSVLSSLTTLPLSPGFLCFSVSLSGKWSFSLSWELGGIMWVIWVLNKSSWSWQSRYLQRCLGWRDGSISQPSEVPKGTATAAWGQRAGLGWYLQFLFSQDLSLRGACTRDLLRDDPELPRAAVSC